MSLASQLLASKPSLFPSFPSPLGFFSDLKSFADSHFSNFRSFEVYRGLTIYAGVSENDTITSDAYVSELSGIHYRDANKNDQFDAGTDVKLADVRVFISSDGAYLLKKYNSLKGKIKDDEVALFLEYTAGDIVSNNVTLVLATERTKEYVASILKSNYIQSKYIISPKRQEIILSTIINESVSALDAVLDMIIQLQDEIIENVTEIGISIFEGIETFFTETLRISDSFWNADDPNYAVGKVGDLIEGHLKGVSSKIGTLLTSYGDLLPISLQFTLIAIEKLADLMLETFKIARLVGEFFIAMVCGVWNGLMDTIGGIFGLVKLVIQGVKGIAKVANGAVNYGSKAEYYNALVVEYLDNMLAEAIKIDWKEVIKSAMKEMTEIANIMRRIPALLIKNIAEVNHTEAGYYVGYILFEIVTWLFPPIKIAKISKLGNLTDFSKIRKASNILPNAPVSKGSNYIDDFFQFIGPFIKKLKEGTESFKEFVLEIFRKFKKWMNELFLGVSKPSNEVTELFRRGKSTTAKGEVRFRRAELDVFARKLEKKYAHLKLKVNIVTTTTPVNKARLKRWDKENVLGSFASGPPPIIHVRQRCTQLTMQHEIWHLEDYSLLGSHEYKKVLNWKHEESVWFKVLKNRDLWTEIELADSYLYYRKAAFDEGGVPIIDQEMDNLIKKYNP